MRKHEAYRIALAVTALGRVQGRLGCLLSVSVESKHAFVLACLDLVGHTHRLRMLLTGERYLSVFFKS